MLGSSDKSYMSTFKEVVCEALESTMIRLVLAAMALGAVPFYFLSLAKASLVG